MRRIYVIAIVAIIAIATSFNATAQQEKRIMVTGNRVYIRINPSTTGGYLVNEEDMPVFAYKNETFTWTGEIIQGFYEIKLGYNFYYISGKYVKQLAQVPATLPDYVEVTGTNVRLRLAPSLKSKTFTNGAGQNMWPGKGEWLKCLGQKGDFWKVSYAGHVVYISKKYTKAKFQ